ncbi:MAG: site-2 protease family protein, partial [Acidobacteriota bacterium]
MSDILIAILAIIFVLGVAINIHEFGHFMIAKFFGMRVEAYSFFGLGPRVFGFKVGNTDYRVSAIPLGAYVKLYGDEATGPLEGGESKGDPVPYAELYELRPRWQKFLVMLGGPFMNIVLALSIPFAIALMYGSPTNPSPIVGYVKPDGAAAKAGVKVGDRIVSFAGIENPSWDRIVDEGLMRPDKPIEVAIERNGQRIPLTLSPTKFSLQGQSAGTLDMSTDDGSEPVVVGRLQSDMPAASSGLKRGDLIVSVNDKTVSNPKEMKALVGEAKDQPIKLSFIRNGERGEVTTNAVLKDDQWLVGIQFDSSQLEN